MLRGGIGGRHLLRRRDGQRLEGGGMVLLKFNVVFRVIAVACALYMCVLLL